MPLRYSPLKIHAYNRGEAGPGHSAFLRDDPEAWNLAFLSHAFEHHPNHTDAAFTVLVRETVNTVLATGLVDVRCACKPKELVRGLLQLRAQDFLDQLELLTCSAGGKSVQLIDRLPLYRAYGDSWLEAMRSRTHLCLPAPVADESLPEDAVPHVRDAAALIERIRRLP